MLEQMIEITAATVITVKTKGSKTPARTHKVHKIKLNSEIWFIKSPIINTLCALSFARYPSPINKGSVAKSVKIASPKPRGRDSSIFLSNGSLKPNEIKKIATPKDLIGSIFVSMCIL